MQTLLKVGGFARNMASLQHLGLHSMTVSLASVRGLWQLLSSLPHVVTTLSLGIIVSHMSVTKNVLWFKANARMRSLRELCLSQWEEVVGGMPQHVWCL